MESDWQCPGWLSDMKLTRAYLCVGRESGCEAHVVLGHRLRLWHQPGHGITNAQVFLILDILFSFTLYCFIFT